MSQNTEQTMRTREMIVLEISTLLHASMYPDDARRSAEDLVAEIAALGAEEQRRKDAEGSLRPMSEAKKNRTPILAKIHDDLFPCVYPERKDLKCWNGRWVVISHTGILADGFDIGWGMAAPVGHGGLTDDWFVGWKPVDYPANVAALPSHAREGCDASNP